MENSTLLVVVGRTAKPVDLEALSETSRERNLHLIVLILGLMPPIPVFAYGVGEFGSYAIPDGWQEQVDRENTALEDLRKKLSNYLADQGASADVRVISGETTSLADAVARTALTCDAITIGDDLRNDDHLFDQALRAALFRAPAGVILNATKSVKALQPKSVFVAWKAGMASARAVRVAMPFLRAADEVTVALVDPVATLLRDGENPGSDIAAWLNHQGCNVSVQQYPSGGEEIGDLLIDRATETGADLIVMGAYDHSRLREVIFGSTTRTLVEQTECPVIFSH